MAHPLAEMFNILEKRQPVACNATCRYWRFPHAPCACVLSDVFSVNQGEPCREYEPKSEETREVR